MRTKLPSNPTSVPEPLTPEESDERNRLAEKLDRQIRELTQTSKQSFQSVIRAFANCLGAPDEQDKNRLIWHGIVGYANADLGSARGIEEGIIAFDIFTSLCMNRLPNSFLEWKNPREDLSPFEDMESAPTRVAYTRKARTLQKQFRTMLFWLADPNGCSDLLRRQALRFLMEHGQKDALRFDASPNHEFSETDDGAGYPFFYWKGPVYYRTILTPVASFILERIDKYQEDELSLTKAIPLIVCKRAKCGKFAVSKKIRKDFCSDSCRTLHYQKSDPARHAKNMREHRARKWNFF